MDLTLLVSVLLGVSFGVNLYQFKYKKTKTINQDAAVTLLGDLLTNGSSLVRIVRVAPEELFLRSPKDLLK